MMVMRYASGIALQGVIEEHQDCVSNAPLNLD